MIGFIFNLYLYLSLAFLQNFYFFINSHLCILRWISYLIQLFIYVLLEHIHEFIPMLFKFIWEFICIYFEIFEHTYNCSFEFFVWNFKWISLGTFIIGIFFQKWLIDFPSASHSEFWAFTFGISSLVEPYSQVKIS